MLIPETFQRIRIAVANDIKAFKCQTPINTNATTKGIDVYYSENGEATKDLEDATNGWMQNPESFENIKSFFVISLIFLL